MGSDQLADRTHDRSFEFLAPLAQTPELVVEVEGSHQARQRSVDGLETPQNHVNRRRIEFWWQNCYTS